MAYLEDPMGKRRFPDPAAQGFGPRLARLRKAARLSQRDLASEANVSPRMVAYYERETASPPAHLLASFAEVLGVSVEVLLGRAQGRPEKRVRDNRLWRRFQQIEKLPPAEKRLAIRMLDLIVERNRLKRQA